MVLFGIAFVGSKFDVLQSFFHLSLVSQVGAPGSSISAPDSGSHLSLSSQRLSGIFGGSQQTETSVYRGNIPGGPGASAAAIQYGGQYGTYSTPAAHQVIVFILFFVSSPIIAFLCMHHLYFCMRLSCLFISRSDVLICCHIILFYLLAL